MRTIAALLLVAGCTTSVSSTEQDIIGGTVSTGDSAVVWLVGYPADKSVLQSCTATLVSPQLLLTAAHCIDTVTHPGYSYGIFTGGDASAYPTLVDLLPHLKPVAQVFAHPSYDPSSTDPHFPFDIAVATLPTPLTTVAPLPLRTTPVDASIIGKPATIIGYGQTTYMEFNEIRHEATTTVVSISSDAAESDTLVIGDTDHRSCLGDSGGPAIVDGEVVGVDSYGHVGCDQPAHYRRVDSYYTSFIAGFLPPPPTSGDAGPQPDAPGADDDGGGGCNGAPGAGLVIGLALLGLRRRYQIAPWARASSSGFGRAA